jgi:hypothetical protein
MWAIRQDDDDWYAHAVQLQYVELIMYLRIRGFQAIRRGL